MGWWRSAVFYHVYPRSFQDSDGDGIGDLNGVRRRLSYLQWLGVDAIWLSPVFLSPQRDFGYDVANYRQIDPLFGTMSDMEALIKEAHALNIRVVLDGVFNHTSIDHPWFQESRHRQKARDNWYLWTEKPNNWTAAFGGSGWTYDEVRRAYYFHSFDSSQPDLNWREPRVLSEILTVMRFWLDKGIDGFRLDVFNAYVKSATWQDNPPRNDLVGRVGGMVYSYVSQNHVFDRDQPELFAILQAFRTLADEYEAVLIGETLDERLEYKTAANYVGVGKLHLAFHFAVLHSSWRNLPRVLESTRTLFLPNAATIVLANHDFSRKGWTVAQRRLLMLLRLTYCGVPFLYYGEEIGLNQARLNKGDIVDPPGKKFWPLYKGRDGARTPMQWSKNDNYDFSKGKPWLPQQHDVQSVSEQQQDSGSLLMTTKTLLSLRREHPALYSGDIKVQQQRGVLIVQRSAKDVHLQIVLNWRKKSQRRAFSGRLLYSTEAAPDHHELRPFEGRIYLV